MSDEAKYAPRVTIGLNGWTAFLVYCADLWPAVRDGQLKPEEACVVMRVGAALYDAHGDPKPRVGQPYELYPGYDVFALLADVAVEMLQPPSGFDSVGEWEEHVQERWPVCLEALAKAVQNRSRR